MSSTSLFGLFSGIAHWKSILQWAIFVNIKMRDKVHCGVRISNGFHCSNEIQLISHILLFHIPETKEITQWQYLLINVGSILSGLRSQHLNWRTNSWLNFCYFLARNINSYFRGNTLQQVMAKGSWISCWTKGYEQGWWQNHCAVFKRFCWCCYATIEKTKVFHISQEQIAAKFPNLPDISIEMIPKQHPWSSGWIIFTIYDALMELLLSFTQMQ